MFCPRYDAGQCRSCQWLPKEYATQLADKQQRIEQLLTNVPVTEWLPPVPSAQQGFRNKAKMVVSGSVERPILGIVDQQGEGVDLIDCPLYPATFAPVFRQLLPFIAKAGLTPYHIARRKGELKYLLLTESTQGGMMLRFVLRSENKVAQLKKVLPELQQCLPQLTVISVNIQPVPMAIMEGEQEIMLSQTSALAETFNGIPLWIRPQSFFQTNPQVAAKLYRTAQEWTQALKLDTLWDLFCGVGGFGLHCARPETHLTGIEISPEAIACARDSASKLGLTQTQFRALDASRYALDNTTAPDVLLVNPPRRGIGQTLCDFIMSVKPAAILYSSCNPETLVKDIVTLKGYRLERVQLFDLFPHTAHSEVLTLLLREQ
ncbi:23S rRNA (uracil(747)-C(5))-methyltransferase RlmC [Rosenbergiella australiborealis]|uniref:23S rRNA (uracil(747)-C(5))-methyltransferase RlmC n=1 Tax=Rosenbergiella australiborealis TaxID=1544696 RepID=A0ABS5T3Q0_9GAMM|nr:23S rRNA (uracil(747)-C(5))-methyltransferase RlmC [Rosenbergiella australiborealis]MBT0726982.1 23S rRNA (uracil(747)-C(5))-methyltransferase RlmC [Rosenbergiella australiborealis]